MEPASCLRFLNSHVRLLSSTRLKFFVDIIQRKRWHWLYLRLLLYHQTFTSAKPGMELPMHSIASKQQQWHFQWVLWQFHIVSPVRLRLTPYPGPLTLVSSSNKHDSAMLASIETHTAVRYLWDHTQYKWPKHRFVYLGIDT